jgi:hypothetical protein
MNSKISKSKKTLRLNRVYQKNCFVNKTHVLIASLTLIPLILSIGIIPSISFVEALQPKDSETQCREGQVLVFRNNSNNYVCVSETTADRWVALGIAERVEQKMSEEVACTADWTPVCSASGQTYSNLCMLEASGGTLSYEGECETDAPTMQEKEIEKILAKIENGESISNSELIMLKKVSLAEAAEDVKQETYPQGSIDPQGTASFGEYAFGTITSMQDSGMGHETHQLAVLLPPSENIYVGKITFSASEPVQYVTLTGPIADEDVGGQPIWSPDGETNFALTFIDNGLASGGWYFAGNALALHTMNPTPFSSSYSIVYAEVPAGEYPKGSVASATVHSMQDPGIGHENHSIALILSPRDIPYQGGVISYSASEDVQLVALVGPLADDEMLGQPTWTADGETHYALTLIEGSDMGVWNTFSGNALALHTMNPDGFTASYTLAGLH